VKVCGLRRAGDATVAIEAGATYLGVVYAGGPRRVSDSEARAIVEVAGKVPVMAVWGRPDLDAILRSRDAAKFSGVQLHGGGDPAMARSLRSHGLIVWRVARLSSAADLDGMAELCEEADAVLVEPRVPGKEGGAGVALDLELARRAKERFDLTKHVARSTAFTLAGGLTAPTVAHAIRLVRPDIVDVSSGVESAPGLKDPHLIQAFLEQALADHSSP
jgi:phosphoribosylanthranilate isomerase